MKDKIIMFLVLASLVIDWDRTLRNFGLAISVVLLVPMRSPRGHHGG